MAYQSFYNPYPNQNYQNPYYQPVTSGTQYGYSQQNIQPQSYTPSPQQYPQLNSGFQWVQGEAAAKAYHVEPGQTVLLMDSDSPVLYYKSTDQSGRPTPMIIYDLIERKPADVTTESAEKVDLSEDVKRDELEEIIRNAVAKSIEKKMGEIKFTATTVNNPIPSIITT